MIDFKKVFVDTAPFIYFIEKDSNNPQYYERVKKFFENGYNKDKKFVSSVITIEEYSRGGRKTRGGAPGR